MNMEKAFNEEEIELGKAVAITTRDQIRPQDESRAETNDQQTEVSRKPVSKDDITALSLGYSHMLKQWRRRLLQTLIAKSQLEKELQSTIHKAERIR